MTEIPNTHRAEKTVDQLSLRELALAVTALKEITPHSKELLDEATKQLERLQRLSEILGKLAPGGTAPRTGLEQLWIQSGETSDESPILLEMRSMLASHWGDWTPAIRQAEGLPPIQQEE